MQQQTKTIYSIFSGTFFELPEKDLDLLIAGQAALTKKPSSSCKKCLGRGHIGRDSQTLMYQPCNCIRKALDLEQLKKNITNSIDINKL